MAKSLKDLRDELLAEQFGPVQEAQDSAADTSSRANWGRVGSNLAAAFGGYKADNSFYDKMDAQGQRRVAEAAQRGQMMKEATGEAHQIQASDTAAAKAAEEEDPSSRTSQTTQGFVGKAFPNLTDSVKTMSHAQILKTFPVLEKLVPKASENKDHWTEVHDSRTGEAADINAATGERRAVHGPVAAPVKAGGGKPSDADSITKLSDKLDPTARTAGAMRVDAERLQKVDNMLGLVKSRPNYDLDKREIRELATGFAALLGGGAAGENATNELIPHTGATKWANVEEYLTNAPQDAGMKEFVKRLEHSIQRQGDLAKGRIHEWQKSNLPAFHKIAEHDRPNFDKVLKAKGLDPAADYDAGPTVKAPAGGVSLEGPHGATVTQDGHTYTWNPATGKYE